MNRKGHLPSILLFVSGFIIVLIAWFSYLSFNGDIGEFSANVGEVVYDMEHDELYVESISERVVEESLEGYTGNVEDLKSKIIERFGEVENVGEVNGNFYGKIRNGDFEIVENGENWIFEVKDVQIEYEKNGNKLKRIFDVRFEFEERGERN